MNQITNEDNLERIVEFSPAFDKRDPDPTKNCGIGAVKCKMVLKGPKGAAHFIFSTGIYLGSTVEEYASKGRWTPERMSYGGWYIPGAPMGYDCGYHSRSPGYEGQDQATAHCPYLNGEPCYSDGSALQAEEVMNLLISEGDEPVWKVLKKRYDELP